MLHILLYHDACVPLEKVKGSAQEKVRNFGSRRQNLTGIVPNKYSC